MTRFFLALAALLFAAPAYAAPSIPACGATVVLTGDQGDWRAPPVRCTDLTAVIFDAVQATFRTIRIAGAQGVTVSGGTVSAPATASAAVTVDGSRFVRLTAMTFTGAVNGVALVRGSDYQVDASHFVGLIADGVDINQAQRVTVDGNTFEGFRPVPAIYDAQGRLVRDGTHGDAVQAYALAGQVANADLTITNNAAFGHFQGVDNFGDVPGTVNVRIEGNLVVTDYWHGIAWSNAKGLIVRGNVVRALPGAKALFFPFQRIAPWIRLPADADACGNAAAEPTSQGLKPC